MTAQGAFVIAGGGTGGHVMPALALGEALRDSGERVLFVGARRGIERRLVPEAGFELTTYGVRPFLGRGPIARLAALLALGIATLRALRLLRRRRAVLVIAVGGYASAPAALAGALLRLPVALVNTDAQPGSANRWLARLAKRVFVGFEAAAAAFPHPEAVRVTGVPLRAAFTAKLGAAEPPRCGAKGERLRLFAFGGSQGAAQLNRALLRALPRLSPQRLSVVHQTGAASQEEAQRAWQAAGFDARVVAFEDDMPARLRWADLVVCRAGAMSVAELALAGRAALLAPLSHVGGGEQRGNARELEAAGAAQVLDARELPPGTDFDSAFAETLVTLLGDPEALREMGRRAALRARPDAAAQIAADCRALARGARPASAAAPPPERLRRVHFVGAGGSGMSGLAELLIARGARVSGSDLREERNVARLRGLGAAIHTGHSDSHLGEADAVVFSSAISAGNPELAAARRRGIPVLHRSELLAALMEAQQGAAIAGSHGKTTTSALTAHIAAACGLDPSVVIGGRVRGAAGARLGGGAWLIAEADESDGSFLRLAPRLAAITNMEAEHLDHYGSAEALGRAFADFANRVPEEGCAVLGVGDPGVRQLLPQIARRRVTYALDDSNGAGAATEAAAGADWLACGLVREGAGVRFRVLRHGETLGEVQLPLPGAHNAANALAALALAAEMGVEFPQAAAALRGFPGVERRFEEKGVRAGVRVVDDYGHHPSELRATLSAARDSHAGRLVAVFQPHRYTRTRDLFAEFAACFDAADLLVLTPVYGAGEAPLPGAGAAQLAAAIRARGQSQVRLAGCLAEVAPALAPELRAGDLVLTLGAGNVGRVGPELLAALEQRG
ncbi:MAG: UDP-N-acetylmuramate--L-alanine ligase [Deltaproteobacteria bacterium]|nr:UDP-N-acetylmuramate--L-alanine ligase [Deltaproteobacteria bacterium]